MALAAKEADTSAQLEQVQARLQAKRGQCDDLANQLAQLEAAVADTQASFETHVAQVRSLWQGSHHREAQN